MKTLYEHSTNKYTGGNGIGFSTILFLVFLVLKLTHVIDWSWWWITAPLWIPIGLSVLLLIIIKILSRFYD